MHILLSNNTVNKTGYVQKEIKVALEAAEKVPEGEIFIIPVRLEKCVVPDRLTKWQWIDVFRPHGFKKIVNSLKTKLVQETAKLIIVEDSRRNMTFTLEKGRNLIGRTDRIGSIFPDTDLTFLDPQSKVSRRHARIIYQEETFFIEDLGSLNGTMINHSIRLSPGISHPLKNGDTLTLADVALKFIISDGAIKTLATQSLDLASLRIDAKSE